MNFIGLFLLILIRPAEAQLRVHCTNVREIDFRNRVYPLNEPRFTKGKELRLRVVDGRYEEPHSPPTQGFLYFAVGDVAFGDLTGDGVEDAAVVATYGSNSGNFHVTDIYIFSCVRGSLTLTGILTQDQIQKDSGTTIWTSVDHPMKITGGALEVTYETRAPQASPSTFRYTFVGRKWKRLGQPIPPGPRLL
jgi:hypothetical protein